MRSVKVRRIGASMEHKHGMDRMGPFRVTRDIMKKRLLGALLFLPFAAWGDYTLTMHGEYAAQAGGEVKTGEMTELFKYRDDTHAKMQIISGGNVVSETYVIGDKCYLVVYRDGKAQIMDYDAMREMAKAAMAQYGTQEEDLLPSTPPENATWRNTGRQVEVGELKGEEWIVSFTNTQGETEQHTLVLSNDEEVRKALKAFGRFMGRILGEDGSGAEKAFLPKAGYGVIKTDAGSEGSFTIEALSAAHIPDSAFRLPEGQSQSLPDDGSYTSPQPGAKKQESAESVSGEASDRQEDSEEQTEDVINQSVDKAVDALKSLF